MVLSFWEGFVFWCGGGGFGAFCGVLCAVNCFGL